MKATCFLFCGFTLARSGQMLFNQIISYLNSSRHQVGAKHTCSDFRCCAECPLTLTKLFEMLQTLHVSFSPRSCFNEECFKIDYLIWWRLLIQTGHAKYLRGVNARPSLLKKGIEDVQRPLPPSLLLLAFLANVQNTLRKANEGQYRWASIGNRNCPSVSLFLPFNVIDSLKYYSCICDKEFFFRKRDFA